MKSKQFNQWVKKVGLANVHRMVREYAKAHKQRDATYQAVQQWMDRGVPANRAICIERISGIPRQQIRPDIYPPEEAA